MLNVSMDIMDMDFVSLFMLNGVSLGLLGWNEWCMWML